jgi:predicted nucleotidyltransferase
VVAYDLLVDFYKEQGFKAREHYWLKESMERMVVREKVDVKDNKVNLRGLVYHAQHENEELPQYQIMDRLLETCRNIEGIDSAYSRGSLARGDADRYSDIDLLCVVTPDKFKQYVEQVDEMLGKNHKLLTPGWVDTIVKDFGGVGFVYLIEEQDKIYQADLYIACQGSPGLQRLTNLPHKQQVFKAKKERHLPPAQQRHLDEQTYILHADKVNETIQTVNEAEDTPEKTLIEIENLIKINLKKENDLERIVKEFNLDVSF